MEQVHAEKNPLYKEVIPYAVVYNSLLKKVLIYEEISEQIPKNYFARMIL
jgi:predicted NUDIX family phosphoesterase